MQERHLPKKKTFLRTQKLQDLNMHKHCYENFLQIGSQGIVNVALHQSDYISVCVKELVIDVIMYQVSSDVLNP
jgi:hypothetical protein